VRVVKIVTQMMKIATVNNKQLSKRELTKILFNTLKEQNGLAIRMIVRDYNNKQMENKNVKQIRSMATNSRI
jgi:FKBP-type peptidyl-prolyl cis-trans isomerase (trigger factor)